MGTSDKTFYMPTYTRSSWSIEDAVMFSMPYKLSHLLRSVVAVSVGQGKQTSIIVKLQLKSVLSAKYTPVRKRSTLSD
jgi:hypothetical protein